MARMIGKTNQPFCGSRCCGDRSHEHNKAAKRRERQGWKREVAETLAV